MVTSKTSEFYNILYIQILDIHQTHIFFVLFNTVHPEDGVKRRPKHVGVVKNNVCNHKCTC
jgi:hypothetical protein